MSYNNVGKVWTPESFGEYLKTLKRPDWCKRICLHHTSAPSLSQRPKGFTAQHLQNLKSFYQGLGWAKGPHFFTDDDQIWGMTPPTIKGIHSVGWNSTAIGIEALGDYDNEDPKSGRGFEVWKTTARATAILLDWLKLPVNKDSITLHRLDKHTSKTCPGSKFDYDWFVSLTKDEYESMIYGLHQSKISFSPQKMELMNRSMVGVAETLIKKGYSSAEIKKNLRRSGKDYFWLDNHLEFAYYYDAKLETAMAPASELENIKSK